MDIELLQQIIAELEFSAPVLRHGINCEVPRKLVNDVYVALAKGRIEDWALTGTRPSDKCLIIAMDIGGNGSDIVMDTGLLYLKVSDRFCIEPR